MIALVTGEVVSPQTVSRLTCDLDEAVQQFHPLKIARAVQSARYYKVFQQPARVSRRRSTVRCLPECSYSRWR